MTNNNYGNEIAEKLAGKIHPIQIKLEIFLLLIFFIGLILIKVNIEIATLLINISLSTFSILYFIMAYWKACETNNKIQLFFNKLIHWSFSVAILGILFTVQRYPGASMMLQVGIYSMIFGLIGILVQKIKYKKNEKLIGPNIIRALIILVVYSGIYLKGDIDELRSLDNQNKNMKQELIKDK
ncbi:MAG: hypothetical protein KAT68_11910 [Bacteroidales bacterium]|nr:hypothetical protein [Bacteroidales bacterium]